MRSEPDSMNFMLWLGAALGVGFGLLASAIAAIASVLKTASISKKRGTLILLFISNVASGMYCPMAAVTIRDDDGRTWKTKQQNYCEKPSFSFST